MSAQVICPQQRRSNIACRSLVVRTWSSWLVAESIKISSTTTKSELCMAVSTGSTRRRMRTSACRRWTAGTTVIEAASTRADTASPGVHSLRTPSNQSHIAAPVRPSRPRAIHEAGASGRHFGVGFRENSRGGAVRRGGKGGFSAEAGTVPQLQRALPLSCKRGAHVSRCR